MSELLKEPKRVTELARMLGSEFDAARRHIQSVLSICGVFIYALSLVFTGCAQSGTSNNRVFASYPGIPSGRKVFGNYDRAFCKKVNDRWNALLSGEAVPAEPPTGKVVLDFHLLEDGSIEGVKVQQNDVGQHLAGLCQRALLESAPFGQWTTEMRTNIGVHFREVRFTFHYR